ncbi:DUF2783 domain-containing protein [Nisaea acidiphila]|uniref:DUF2783 domain-containing protein n=1 Tax=Nisaea acidiphila TaxID=1862145 RepID=A0A9J7AWK6_9PROT|nr:DUF2783 domain-containing protein [Nisaea acidiphila]UUX51178.1 DUF2783 domain-containing protein [Nisaea acidiphila]
MSVLKTSPNLQNPDGFYAELLAAHEGLTKAQSDALNARLILLLANQIGDREKLSAVIGAARGLIPAEPTP